MTDRPDESEPLTFLFTDVERSSEAWLKRSLEMTLCIPAINGIVEGIGTERGGVVFGREGDGRALHFADPGSALEAAVAIQQGIADEAEATGHLQLRIGVHSGSVYRLSDGELGGTPLNYVGRMHSAGHGGQIVVSTTTKMLLGSFSDRFLWTNLGVYALRDFQPERLWQVDVGDDAPGFPPLRTKRRFEAPKPAPDPLIGRAEELGVLNDMSRASRVTTVTGPGGIGKTRLVRGFIETHGDRFTDGVCFVDLQRIATSQQVTDAVANALGIDTAIAASPIHSVRDALIGSDALVVLDNSEHVRAGAASIAAAIVDAGGPTVIATSRAPLLLDGESVYPIGPLRSAADGAGDGEQLFLAAAMIARPGFVLNDQTALIVTRLCEQLGGVPLAIELAAAQMATLGPRDLLQILDDDLAVLDAKDPSARTSVRSALRWSVDALDQNAAELGILLAQSRPDAGLAELEQLSDQHGAPLLRALQGLVATGIVRADGIDDTYRYRMLEPLRSPFAKLNESTLIPGDVTARQAAVYSDLARRLGAAVQGADEVVAVSALTADVGNIRAALLHDISEGRLDRAARTVAALHMYGFLRMRYEVYSWVDTVLTQHEDPSRDLKAELTGMAAFRSFNRGNVVEAVRLAQLADELTPVGGQITSRVVLMAGHGMAGKYELANNEFNAGLRWCDEREQPFYRTNLHVIASMGLTAQGVFDVAADLAGRGLELAEDVANPSAVAWALTALADARRHDAPAEASRILVSALEIARSVSNRWVEGQALLNLTRAYRCAGDLDRAAHTCVDALAHCQQQANQIQTRQGVREAFLLLHELDEYELAAKVMGPLRGRPDTLPPSPDQQAVVDRAFTDVQSVSARPTRAAPRASIASERDAVAFSRSSLIGLVSNRA